MTNVKPLLHGDVDLILKLEKNELINSNQE